MTRGSLDFLRQMLRAGVRFAMLDAAVVNKHSAPADGDAQGHGA